ncbi:alanyl-tRNA editing protein [Fonticella tunisiensis]|uniref:Alanyl-tRNA synthetase n=1 Tax=Fonticella tunisiensis TaxID=1096341 RepID=A0A4R7KAM7_9CLOT|nr:DHHA1 domain-containing protein [Fonticella tunisiensis]TDT50815.1 alanyl-tRNA synthetase [Fonticella tunisiensis]
MTRLYYDNPYLTSWEAEVIDVVEKEGKFAVTLSQTAFYPEGGGQPSDRGTIDGIQLLDVIEDGGIIYHIHPSKPQSQTVRCEVDFQRRFDHMQQHTGQHILSAVFYNLYSGETSSFHLGEDYVSIDISLPEISDYMLRKVEDTTNDYIYKNLKVKTYIIKPDEVSKLPLRKLPPVADSIRIVEIDGVDYSPCCGTHVRSLGEIGIIKIIKTEKYKGATRVYFKCGKRALLDYQAKQDIVASLSRQFTASEGELIHRGEALSAELKNLSKEVRDLKEKLLGYEAKEIIAASSSNLIVKSFDDKSFEDIQLLSKQIVSLGDYVVILTSTFDRKILLAHSGKSSIHCGKLFKEHLLKYNGRGGGGDRMAQALFADVKDLKSFEKLLVETVKAQL